MRSAGQLTIGPVRFELRTNSAGPVRYSDPAYGGFFSSGSPAGGPEPLAVLPVDLTHPARPIPTHEPLWRGGKNWAVWEDGRDLVCCAGFTGREDARWSCRVARDLSGAELALASAADSAALESPLVYPLDQILSWGLLSRFGGILLHASVAVRDGMGWVFTGVSGAGKSTLAGLCHAAGYRILNDDRVMVFRRDGRWKVAGTPWHGSGRFAEAAEVPLGGIFFLQQAESDRMGMISPDMARLAILDTAAVPWFEDQWSQGILDGLARLVEDVECRRFHFTKTPAAVRALEAYQLCRMGGAA